MIKLMVCNKIIYLHCGTPLIYELAKESGGMLEAY